MFLSLFRRAHCASSSREEVHFITEAEHAEPLRPDCEWMNEMRDTSKYRKPGPRFDDGSINWQCPCMAGGSLVAHRCGFFFRKLYVCMKDNEGDDATQKCPEQFIDWAACMQNMSEERRQQMQRTLRDEDFTAAKKT